MPLHSLQRGERLEVLEEIEIDVVDRRYFEVTVSCRHVSNLIPEEQSVVTVGPHAGDFAVRANPDRAHPGAPFAARVMARAAVRRPHLDGAGVLRRGDAAIGQRTRARAPSVRRDEGLRRSRRDGQGRDIGAQRDVVAVTHVRGNAEQATRGGDHQCSR